MKIQKFEIEGMTCAACVSHIEKSVAKLKGIKNVQVNLLTNSMKVEFDENDLHSEEIENAVENAGYKARLQNFESTKKVAVEKPKNNELLQLKTRWWLSFAFLIPLMYISMGNMIGLAVPTLFKTNFLVLSFSQFLLSMPIIIINHKYFSRGFGQIFNAPNMDSLVATGSSAAFIYGIWIIFKASVLYGNGHVNQVHLLMHDLYFESGSTILTLVTLGKYLEAISKSKTTSAITKLIDLAPKNALVIRNNEEKSIPVEEIEVGDVIIIKSGDRIPVDGKILSGYGNIDTSAITGESMPVFKETGDVVNSATINIDGYFTYKATAVGEDTTLAQIIRLVEEAAASKAPVGKLADKISGIFVPVVIGIAIFSGFAWMLAGYSFSFALSISISVLVISCPCALGLATPLAIMVGTGKGAQNGILIKSAGALETTARIDTVVLDKTGTITTGKPQVVDILPYSKFDLNQLLSIAASLESVSEHPIAHAIVEESKKRNIAPVRVEASVIFPGKGISGIIDNNEFFIGNDKLLILKGVENTKFSDFERLSSVGKTPLYIFDQNEIIGLITIADTIKPDSKEAITIMHSIGLQVVMLTGDNEFTAKNIQEQTGIYSIYANLLPDEKDAAIQKFQKEGRKIAMIGDGINDAPALTRADVGIAIGTGTQIAIEAADIVLMHSSLMGAVDAVRLSKKTFRNIKENLFWAFFYNVIFIPIAAGVLYLRWGIKLDPMFAAAAMSLSSVTVVLNALRINMFKSSKSTNNFNKNLVIMKQKSISIEGMSCGHCSARVEKALNALEGVTAKVDLAAKKATVSFTNETTEEQLKKAVEDAGYEVVEIK